MKKLVFVLFLFSFWFSAIAQTVSYAPPGANWHSFNSNYSESEYFWNRYEKDTLIEGHLCSKIGGYIIKALTPALKDTISNSVDFVYTGTDTIFYFNTYYSRFFPLYILNVKAGDSIKYHVPYPLGKDTMFRVKIHSVDTVYISGRSLRRYIAEPASGTDYFEIPVFIERIGPVYATSPVIPTQFIRPSDSQPYLRCYHDHEIDSNLRPMGIDMCDYAKPLSTEEFIYPLSPRLFPNPAREQSELQFPEVSSGTLMIIGSEGRIVYTENIADQRTFTLKLSSFSPGVYHLCFRSSRFVYHQLLTILP
ncbi:hypothetical protein [Rurimicrobium arvi]|uniref:Secretion system C-terminal sorting domain-containing protein n=1 Tax=Rurimicrobium arvi TaxID=2049916 RepID=A0ABP8MH73_9BACT